MKLGKFVEGVYIIGRNVRLGDHLLLTWEKIEDPGQGQSDAYKFRKNFYAIQHSFPVCISGDDAKYYRDEGCKQDYD